MIGDIPQNMRINDATGEIYYINWFDTLTVPTQPKSYTLSKEQSESVTKYQTLEYIRLLVKQYGFSYEDIFG